MYSLNGVIGRGSIIGYTITALRESGASEQEIKDYKSKVNDTMFDYVKDYSNGVLSYLNAKRAGLVNV